MALNKMRRMYRKLINFFRLPLREKIEHHRNIILWPFYMFSLLLVYLIQPSAVIYEIIISILAMFLHYIFKETSKMNKRSPDKFSFVEREVEKRERLVQTYIVLFGLLASYAQIGSLQKSAMYFLLSFMFSIMFYYVLLTSIPKNVLEIFPRKWYIWATNLFAVFSTFILSFTLTEFNFRITGGNNSAIMSVPVDPSFFNPSTTSHIPVIAIFFDLRNGDIFIALIMLLITNILLCFPLLLHRYVFEE